jgi:predicted PurR-regulated permease PerM
MDIVQLIAYAIFIVIVGILLTAFGKSRRTIALLDRELKQSKLDYLTAVTKINELAQEREDRTIEQSEGFLKFLSQSRDWAFEYIESVQNSIQNLKNSVESGNNTEEELAKLFSFLPENKEK